MPLVAVLTVRIARDLAYDASILGLLLTFFGVGTVVGSLLTARSAMRGHAGLLGRVGSTARTISLGLQPVGLLVGGALIDLTGGSTTMALMGLPVAIVSFVFLPIRALRLASLPSR